jgi:UPF0755 protein
MKKVLIFFCSLIILIAGVAAYVLYQRILSPNVTLSQSEQFFYVHTGSSFNQVCSALDSGKILKEVSTFRWLAEKMNYPDQIRPGRYLIKNNMSNRALLQLLRSGVQTPVRLTFNNIRTKADLAERLSSQIEADSMAIFRMLNDSGFTASLGFNTNTILCMFLPNTYQVYWNTSAEGLFKRMKREYDAYWNPMRLQKAKDIGLTPIQVSILASIVQSETNQNSEKPRVAGVYMNRLRKQWKLEADPTLVYALGDFTIKRVLNEYKEIDSPYNTYKYFGLPPGPICLAEISSINAVLNFEQHDYMYFCAREDMSGFHSFAKDYQTHLLNARRYQAELTRHNIRS